MVNFGMWLPSYGGWLPGVDEEERGPTYSYVKKVALRAEEEGIDSLWIPDHLLNPVKGAEEPSLEAWTLAAGIAEATESINISHTTLCEAFRYPAVLAKQAATMADLSDDRFWLSIGAGWYKREYEAFGLDWIEHDKRVDRTEEAIKIICRLWQDSDVNFQGGYYSIESGNVAPKPAPRPPIWYGGNSEASKKLVARQAEGWLMGKAKPEKVRKNIEDMESRLKQNGRDQIEYAVPAIVFVRDSDREAEKYVRNLMKANQNALENSLATGLVGSPETVAEGISQFENSGVDHILLHFTPTLDEFERFVDEVMPLFN